MRGGRKGKERKGTCSTEIFASVMAEEDPIEDVRQYLARDENSAKEQFTASLDGKSSEELVALFTSQRNTGDNQRCCGASGEGSSTKSNNQYGIPQLQKDDVKNVFPVSKNVNGENAISSATSTERLVEITRVETSRDELSSHNMMGSEERQSTREEHSAAWHAMRSGVLVTKEELEEVQREMFMQERVLKALEKDNADLHAERRTLRSKLSEMEQKAVTIEAKYSILTSGQNLNNCVNQRVSSVTPPTQEKQRCVQDEERIELEHQKTLVRELQLELELLRREKKDIEMRLANLDSRKFEEMELELRNLRVDLKRKETQHSETVKDMARKIAWYVEHQEFNHSQEELLKEQQDTIRRLQARLHEIGAMDDEGKHKRVKKDARIQYLTRRVAELEEALNNKYPNSIAQLIRSCQPSVQDTKQFKQLNLRIRELEEALVEKDRCAEAAVNRLRVETDRMRVQYQERIDKLEEELKLRLLHAQTRRVRELEKQLADTRQTLRERELEKTPPVLAVANPSSTSGCLQEKNEVLLVAPEETKNSVAAIQTGVDTYANEVILLLRKENDALRNQLSHATSDMTRNSFAMSPPQDAGPPSAFSPQLFSSMQKQLGTITAELEVYKRLLMESQESLRDAHARWEERLVTVRQSYQCQIQQIRQEHNDDIKRIQDHHQQEVKSIAEEVQAAEEASKTCQKLVYGIPEDPRHSRAFLQSVAERLAYLERRHVQKERETAHEIAEVRRVANFELTLAKQRAELLIEQKNQQIHEFRLQLDQLVASLSLLQSHA